ncbi:glycoside hydrolase family 3 C-terminal domain-containing protein [Faecalicatena orotica]|uniref:Beta-glucosidase n=1 Tax=Faecalicatena orotica TaxID=1544 RepID=A0A2Y9BML5_9FIRM|nr:glycoside hydrolase family 3 C-terminal domain-containing protein [Faecalicatena orotica]PWJ17066.1 beta-glucosidase [Faecalicatena orotica]SSA58823.1 beta-glucosidase [Faecalicatena orotica]
MEDKMESKLQELTIEEKVGLLSGADFWTTKEVKRVNLPSFMMTDGPNGLRKQVTSSDHLGMNESLPATCFPMACALACSWDRELLYEIGKALSEECIAADVDILLGPGVNLKRSPLGGRNFEYFSEDPYLTSQLAAKYIKGVQENGTGTSLKHFAANNQETRRMVSDSLADERTLRELYLACFESVVKEAEPWTVMCSYNKLNGTYTSEHDWLLNQVLKKEWQYDGAVVSDWGAVNEKVKSVQAGLDLEMPGNQGESDRILLEAVKNGEISEDKIDEAVTRILRLSDYILEARAQKNVPVSAEINWENHHKLARESAGESMVLLKNENKVLPLASGEKIAVLGELASDIRYQGTGSCKVHPYHVDSPFEEIRVYEPSAVFAKGYLLDGGDDGLLLEEAEAVVNGCDKVIIFAGYPERAENEGEDKVDMKLPYNQTELIHRIARTHPAVIVVLCNGSPVEMPFSNEAEAILETYLAGEAAGGAAADILFGKKNPSGKLSESFPVKLEDNPSYLNFPGMQNKTRYGEGIFVGYRYYDKKNIEPLYPFGHGLSYTEFTYSNLSVSAGKENTADVTLEVQNTGDRYGAEVVQIYVQKKGTEIIRAVQELKGFEKVRLEAGEKKQITIHLPKEAFRYYDAENGSWQVEPGEYEILAGASSRDIRLKGSIVLEGDELPPYKCDQNSTIAEISRSPEGKAVLEKWMKWCSDKGYPIFTEEPEFIQNAYETTPLRWVKMLSGGCFTEEMIEDVLSHCNR